MLIKIIDPEFQTVLFSVVFFCILLVSLRKNRNEDFLSKETTNQIKGFAVLAVVFTHIGYGLSSPNQFLYPLSTLGGVGVNLFLFLSGFGLTLSHLKSPLSPLSFYKKRLSKLFIPLWIVITTVLLLDFLLLQRTYPLLEIVRSYLGFFTRADLYQNLDSPLWYFSIIFFYYFIFPLTFIKKLPLISPILVLGISLLILNLPLPINPDVLTLYKLHTLAFPLGILFGLTPTVILSTAKDLKSDSSQASLIHQILRRRLLRMTILILFVLVFLYTSINSGVGQNAKIEQGISLLTTFSIIIIFAFSKLDFKLLSLFGIYSYEIYLLHWPILSRFNPFLGLPPFLMVIFNLIFIFSLGYALQKLIGWATKRG